MNMTAIRLRKLRKGEKLSQGEVAQKLGISRTAYVKYETGESRPVRKLNELSHLFHVSADYIMGMSDYPLSNKIAPPAEARKIPIIGTVTCGPNGFAYEYLDGYVYIDDCTHGDVRAFHCKGDSMTGLGIFDGDIAIVRIQPEVENGELAVVTINGDEGTLKWIRKQDHMIILEAANPNYPPRVFAGEETNLVHIVGKVIEVRKQF